MQLKLTWRVHGQSSEMNLLVSEEQRIQETLQVLAERKLVPMEAAETAGYVRALRTNHLVNTRLTYKEAGIYSGDILQILSDAERCDI